MKRRLLFRWAPRPAPARSETAKRAYRRYSDEPRGAEAAATLSTLSDTALEKLQPSSLAAIFQLKRGNALRLLALERLKRRQRGGRDG